MINSRQKGGKSGKKEPGGGGDHVTQISISTNSCDQTVQQKGERREMGGGKEILRECVG